MRRLFITATVFVSLLVLAAQPALASISNVSG